MTAVEWYAILSGWEMVNKSLLVVVTSKNIMRKQRLDALKHIG